MNKHLLFVAVLCSQVIFLGAQSSTFNYTGAVQTYTVPACVTSITVDVQGAQGGLGGLGCQGYQGLAGLGGSVQATIAVVPGDVLSIYVGGAGAPDNNTSAAGGFNGGGNALLESMYTYYGGGGGGGASDIRLNGTTLNDRIVVAGGGGGAGFDGCNCEGLDGGMGGGLIGGAGNGGLVCVCNPSGQGGTQVAGGVKGDWGCNCDAQPGTLGVGGNSNSTSCGGPTGGGGGGGGYYGGGGGGLGAGGGGSSYTDPSATGVTHTQGTRTGDGVVIITPVGGQPNPGAITGAISMCENATGNYSIAPMPGATSYTWTVPAGTTINSGQGTNSINVTAGSTSGNITVFATYPCGNSGIVSLAVSMGAAPVVTASAPPILCNGGSSTVTVTASGGTAPYTGTGTFTVTAGGPYIYNVTDNIGCAGADTVTLTEPTMLIAGISATLIQCNGGTSTVVISGSGGTGPYTGEGTFIQTAGSYTYTITDANGCVSISSATLTQPPPLVTSVTTVTNPTTCGGIDGGIDISVSGGATPYAFMWTNSATTEDLTGVGAGSYSVTITDGNGCTDSLNGTLIDPNTPVVTLSLPIDTVCVTNGAFALGGESPAGGTFSGPGVSAGMFDPATAGAGTHAITYMYADSNACGASSVDSIYVDICLDLTSPSAPSMFTVYPNPNNGTFTLQCNAAHLVDVLIYDAQGKLVSTHKVQSSTEQISIAESGVYMITVIFADGYQRSERVIVIQ